jgi:hypothetical protein
VHRYEERITLWRADSFDQAIERAEEEAESYAEDVDATYLVLSQAYLLADSVEDRRRGLLIDPGQPASAG